MNLHWKKTDSEVFASSFENTTTEALHLLTEVMILSLYLFYVCSDQWSRPANPVISVVVMKSTYVCL